jgi:hypothetical protein
MKGLILKDFIAIKKQCRVLILLALFYIVYSVAMKNISMFGVMISLISTMMAITTVSYDEYYKWDKYALSMPISRKSIVLSKYLLGFLADLVGIAVVLPISILIGVLTQKVDIVETLLMVLVFGATAMTFLAIVLPVFFKFGMEKGRLIMMAMIFLPTVLGLIISKSGIQPPSEAFLNVLPYILVLAFVIVLVLSIQISIAIYNKKEF